jgi:Cu-Zn family superoxide dismutase
MRNRNLGYALTLGGIVAAATLVGGCKKDQDTATTRNSESKMSRESTGYAAADAAKQATAMVEPSKAPGMDDVKGVVHFTQAGSGVKIHAVITGLSPNQKHGFHIHEKGDLSAPDLASAGAHFNPGGHKHGGPEGTERHGGDLGNLTADASGKATYEATIEGLTLDESKTGIIGRSVIVHEKPDDMKTDPSGSSGARVAGGVIKMGGSGADK